jgi:hypothetical protein
VDVIETHEKIQLMRQTLSGDNGDSQTLLRKHRGDVCIRRQLATLGSSQLDLQFGALLGAQIERGLRQRMYAFQHLGGQQILLLRRQRAQRRECQAGVWKSRS